MGFWYFLILFAGIGMIVKGLRRSKKISLVVAGFLCVSFAIFMFTPGSDVIIADLLQLN